MPEQALPEQDIDRTEALKILRPADDVQAMSLSTGRSVGSRRRGRNSDEPLLPGLLTSEQANRMEGGMGGMRAALIATLLLTPASVAAGAQESEPLAIAEIGAAGDWGIRNSGSAYGPSFAVEVTPIENWLELEAGVTPFFSSGQTEWDVDLVFKKPFELNDAVEFMVGLGPEWAHTVNGGHATNSVGGEAVLDFMFWPWPERTVGLYVEPSYGYNFGSGRDQSLSVSAGLLIPIS